MGQEGTSRMQRIANIAKNLALTLIPDGALFYLKAARYIYHVDRFSELEEPELNVVKHLVQPRHTAVDVGANVGWYTNYLSNLVGKNGKVIALEPIPETFALLSICAKALHLTNVELFNVGASEVDGSAVMEIPEYASGGANYYMSHIVDCDQQSGSSLQREVRLRSLDSLLRDKAYHVDFIKCDVEGHELQLIKGAQATMKAGKAAWLIEVSRSSDPDLDGSNSWQLFTLLEAHGYSAWWFDRDVLRKRKQGDKALNYFFLK